MVGQKPLIGILLTTGFAYGLYPYVALYELGQAIRQGDAVRLETMVDWASVREGIKEDICDQVVEQPEPAQDSGQLAAIRRGLRARHRNQYGGQAGDARGAGRGDATARS